MAYPLTGSARSSAGLKICILTEAKVPATRAWSPFPTYLRSTSGMTLWPSLAVWPATGQGWPRIKQL